MTSTPALVAALIFAAALLYSSVGNAGAFGYLAVMALCGVSAAVMKPTAVCLNVLVAAIATMKFCPAGCFSWPTFWPFAVTSIPLAFMGGAIDLPAQVFRPIVGVVLVCSAVQTLRAATETPAEPRPIRLPWALAGGAAPRTRRRR
jgi:uncharacterized membrane protein YfcA